jgi:hypothetical protein
MVLEEGENRIEVRVVDPNGRESVIILRVVRDTLPPIIDLHSPTTTDSVTQEGMVVFAGLAETATYLTIDQRHEQISPGGSFEFQHELEAGSNTIELEVRDLAGNSDILVLTIEWDASPPDLRLDALPDRTREEFILLNGTTEGETVTVDGVPVPILDGAFSVPLHLAMGHNTFDVEAFDAAGNVASHHLVIDREKRLGKMQAVSWTDNVMKLLPIIAAVAALAATVVLTRGKPKPVGPPNGHRRSGRPRPPPQAPTVSEAREEQLVVDVPEPEAKASFEATPDDVAGPADGPPGGSSALTELPPESAEQLAAEEAQEEVIEELPDEPVPPKDSMVAETHNQTIPAEETMYEGSMKPEAEMQFAPLPMYSVPDPSSHNGEVHINGDGDISVDVEESEVAEEMSSLEPEIEPGPELVNEPEPKPVPDPPYEPGQRSVRAPEARPVPVPVPVAASAPRPVPRPVPKEVPRPRPSPVPRSAPIKEPEEHVVTKPEMPPPPASSDVVEISPTGQVVVDVVPTGQEIREVEMEPNPVGIPETVESEPVTRESSTGPERWRPRDRSETFGYDSPGEAKTETHSRLEDIPSPPEEVEVPKKTKDIDDLLNDLDILNGDSE